MLKEINNENIKILNAREDNLDKVNKLFVFLISHEKRSIEIFKRYFLNTKTKILCILMKSQKAATSTEMNYKSIKHRIPVINEVDYSEDNIVIDLIIQNISEEIVNDKPVEIHIDYSSMPRSWYCIFPNLLYKIIRKQDKAFFWYTEGDYRKKAEFWPSAGIDDFLYFSGQSSIRPDNNRSHIIGIGFDNLRSQAICSTLDPNYLVISYSHPRYYDVMRDVILSSNKELIDSSAYLISLPTDDFLFSINKLIETINELYSKGDVVLIPDGPKPQILAFSILPLILNKKGIICLHVKRHEECYEPVQVHAKGGFFGFSFRGSI